MRHHHEHTIMNTHGDVIDGIIFDLDGTLLDTLQSLANCYNRVLERSGYPAHPVSAYRKFIGDGARTCVTRCLPEDARRLDIIDQVLARQQIDYAESWQLDAAPYPGIKTLLAQLVDAGVRLSVLSNKDHEFTRACVAHFFAGVPFEQVVGYSPEVPHKPDPSGALTIARAMQLAPQHMAFIGDTAVDMQTATACQMMPVGALWGFRDEPELLCAGARHLLKDPLAMLSLMPTKA